MAQGRKYAALPDLDSAPDVYETQEPADDDDARSATSDRSSSAASSYQDLDEAAAPRDPAASGVDRAQLQPADARSHFKPSRVDARRVDFSDRVGGARRSYKVASRRRRTEFQGVASTDDETYDEKLARLKREVEELQSLGNKEGNDATPHGKDVVNDLSTVLHGLEASIHAPSTTQDQHDENGAPAPDSAAPSTEDLASISVPDMAQTERALQLAATLEGRLTALESALGLPALSLPQNTNNSTATSQAADQPVFATLATLDRHLTTLTTTTGPTLSSLASQIQSLTASAQSLTAARKAATAARKDLRATATTPGPTASSRPISSQSFSTSRPSSYARTRAPADPDAPADDDAPALADSAATLLAGEDSEQARRVARLHAALPTVEHLAPLVPAVLERLASLRALHEGAAGAAGALDALEKGQARLAGDVREWRAAVAELEGRLVEGRAGDARNRDVVKGWVEELQGRLDQVVSG